MHIIVRLFASHREAAGVAVVALDLPADARAADAFAKCRETHPGLPPLGTGVAFAVNREFAVPGARLSDGDEVAVLPPVAGG